MRDVALAAPPFRTIQGEGALLGLPMVFVRLAGCSVGCPECDTDYRVRHRLALDTVVAQIATLARPGEYVWLTGGEPTDHDLTELCIAVRALDLRLAVATSGTRPVPSAWKVDFLSVSPHRPDWRICGGSELKLVPGLNGLVLEEIAARLPRLRYDHYYVMPLAGRLDSVAQCVSWVEAHPQFRLTVQAHQAWKLA